MLSSQNGAAHENPREGRLFIIGGGKRPAHSARKLFNIAGLKNKGYTIELRE
jgi:hypothetical protein